MKQSNNESAGGGESRPARTCDEPAKPFGDVTQAADTWRGRKEAGVASGPAELIQ